MTWRESFIDPAGHARVCGKEIVLNFVDVVFQAGCHRLVLVDHLVKDRAHTASGPSARNARLGFHAPADPCEVR